MENETQSNIEPRESREPKEPKAPRERRTSRPSNDITEMVDRLAAIWERLEKSRFICVNGRSQSDIGDFVSTINEAAEFQENRSLINTINALSHGNQRNFNDYLFNNKIVFWCLLTNFNTISTNLKRHKMFYINFDRQEKTFSVKINEEISTNYNPMALKNNQRKEHRSAFSDELSENASERIAFENTFLMSNKAESSENKQAKNRSRNLGTGSDFSKSAPKQNYRALRGPPKTRTFEENSKYAENLNVNNFKQEEKKFTTGIRPQTFDASDTPSVPFSVPSSNSAVKNTTAPVRPILQKSWADETDD